MRKVYFKYLVMKVRGKISYMSFKKRMTISELFLKTILHSYKYFIKTDQIVACKNHNPEG